MMKKQATQLGYQATRSVIMLMILSFTVTLATAQNKVLIIGIDGCKPDCLLEARTPNLDQLWKNGAYSFNAQTDPISSSGICWTGMLTGVWHEKHKVISNEYKNPNLSAYPHFFHRIKEQNPTMKTYSVVNWSPIHNILQEGDADIANYLLRDKKVSRRAVDLLKDSDPDVLFVQLDEVDGAGHKHDYTTESQQYLKAIEKADLLVGKIVQAIKERPTFHTEDWLILVSTDHGGSNFGHGKDIPEHTTIFYIANGNNVKKGLLNQQVNVVDIAVTALKHLGIQVNPEWDLDGKSVGI
ncbi:alkaline phosphatase family protein [Sunxiuqinia rutila]|uniref:alkaline phosphatase family protein n=1 Tax=Sunxiuqinia rutila TaxID=1397841 RepID=UPI003D3643EA